METIQEKLGALTRHKADSLEKNEGMLEEVVKAQKEANEIFDKLIKTIRLAINELGKQNDTRALAKAIEAFRNDSTIEPDRKKEVDKVLDEIKAFSDNTSALFTNLKPSLEGEKEAVSILHDSFNKEVAQSFARLKTSAIVSQSMLVDQTSIRIANLEERSKQAQGWILSEEKKFFEEIENKLKELDQPVIIELIKKLPIEKNNETFLDELNAKLVEIIGVEKAKLLISQVKEIGKKLEYIYKTLEPELFNLNKEINSFKEKLNNSRNSATQFHRIAKEIGKQEKVIIDCEQELSKVEKALSKIAENYKAINDAFNSALKEKIHKLRLIHRNQQAMRQKKVNRKK